MKKSSPKSTSSLFGSFKSKKSDPITVTNGNAKEAPKKVLHLNGEKGDITIRQEPNGAVSVTRVPEALYFDENGEHNNRSTPETEATWIANNFDESEIINATASSFNQNKSQISEAHSTPQSTPSSVEPILSASPKAEPCFAAEVTKSNELNNLKCVQDFIDHEANREEKTFSDVIVEGYKDVAEKISEIINPHFEEKLSNVEEEKDEKDAVPIYKPIIAVCPAPAPLTKEIPNSSDVPKADQTDNKDIPATPEVCFGNTEKPIFVGDIGESFTDSSKFEGDISLDDDRETIPVLKMCSGYTNPSEPIPIDTVVEIHDKRVEEKSEVIRRNVGITESTFNRDESVGKCGVLTAEFVDEKNLEDNLITGCTEKAVHRRVKVCGGYLMLESTEIDEHKVTDTYNKVETTSDTCSKVEITSNIVDNVEATNDVSNKVGFTIDASDNIETITDRCDKTEITVISNTEATNKKVYDVETVDCCSVNSEDEICSDVDEDETCCHSHQRIMRKNSCCYIDDDDVYNVSRRHGYCHGRGRIQHSDANHKYSTKHVDPEVEVFDYYNQRGIFNCNKSRSNDGLDGNPCTLKNCPCEGIQSVDIRKRELDHKKDLGHCYAAPSDGNSQRAVIDSCEEKVYRKKKSLSNDLLVNIIEDERRGKLHKCDCQDNCDAFQSNIPVCNGKSIHGRKEKIRTDSTGKNKQNVEQKIHKHCDTVTAICGEKKNINRKEYDGPISDSNVFRNKCHDRESLHRNVEVFKNSDKKLTGKNRHCDEEESVRICRRNSSHDRKDLLKWVESDRKVHNGHLSYTKNRPCGVLSNEEYCNRQSTKKARRHDVSVFQNYPTNCCNLCDANNETIRYGNIETAEYCRSSTTTMSWNNMKKSASIWDNTKIEIEVIPINDIANIAVNSEVLITAKFMNPLSTHLSNGRFYIQAPSLDEQYCFEIDHISAGEEVVCKALMHPKNYGYEFIVARFTSSEIKRIVGFTNIKVESTAMVMHTSYRCAK